MKKRILLLLCLLTALCVLLSGCATLAAMGLMGASQATAKVEVYEDVSAYSDFFGDSAKEEHRGLLDMDQSVFPAAISENMDVREFKMVYYNPYYADYIPAAYLPEGFDAAEGNPYQRAHAPSGL